MVPAEAEEARAAAIATSHPLPISASLAQRQAQYPHIHALHQHGLAPSQIALRVGLSERTISRWLARGAAPHRRHHSRGRSVIDPYKASVLKRWQEGVRKGSQVCQELKAVGYRGSERAVYRYLTFLQATLLPAEQTTTSGAALQQPFSAKQAVGLLIRQPEELTEQHLQELLRICQASPQIEKAYHLAQSFGTCCGCGREKNGLMAGCKMSAGVTSRIAALRRRYPTRQSGSASRSEFALQQWASCRTPQSAQIDQTQ